MRWTTPPQRVSETGTLKDHWPRPFGGGASAVHREDLTMPFITATYDRRNESITEATAIVRGLLEDEKTRYNDAAVFGSDAEWLDTQATLTANLPYTIRDGEVLVISDVEPEVVVVAICTHKSLRGRTCGRELPCNYKSHN